MRRVETEQAPKPIGPYSQALLTDNGFLYLSGQIPLDPQGRIVGSTIEEQTRQVFRNIRAVLEAAGYQLSDVVKTTVFLQEGDTTAGVSPTGAVVRSLLLPGWGQIYTGHPIKAAVIAAAFGTSVGVSVYYYMQFQQQQRLIEAYQEQYQTEAPLSMIQVREYYRDRRDEFLIYTAIIYAIAALDAYVDAHLVDFDVSPDLSAGLHLQPVPLYRMASVFPVGIQLQVQLRVGG